MKKLISTSAFLAILLMSVSQFSYAGLVVIVNAQNPVDSLSKKDVTRIFLGKRKEFPSRQEAVPLNHADSTDRAIEFAQKVLSKSRSQMNSYWSRMIFTGKGQPPKQIEGGDAEVVQQVANNPKFVSYVNKDAVDASVKVVYEVP